MNTTQFLVVLFLLAGIVEIFWGNHSKRTSKKHKKIVSNERIRDHFAKTRQELIHIAADGDINFDSYTFESMYTVFTFILRRPDRYVEIGEMLTEAIVKESKGEDAELAKEAKHWNDRTRNLFLNTGKGLAIFIDEFAPWNRIRSRLEAKILISICDFLMAYQPEEIRNIREAQISVNELAVPVGA